MTDMFATTSVGSLGCTFVEWSINYLAGNDSYYRIWPSYLKNKNGTANVIPLVDNPLRSSNAHGHDRNHPHNLEETKRVIGLLQQQEGGLRSCYPWSFDRREHTQIIEYCLTQSIPVVFVTMPKDVYLFTFIGHRATTTWIKDDQGNEYPIYRQKPIDQIKTLISEHFSHSADEWESAELWDLRELIALNLYSMHKEDPLFLEDIKDDNLYRVSAPMLWHSGDELFPEIFRRLDLKLDEERFSKWKPVYNQWQAVLRKQVIDFYYNLDFIVASIVHNLDLDLSQFNMSLTKEIVIQAELIKKHNLTIKGWGLEKFPGNATDLHKLLEESFYDA